MISKSNFDFVHQQPILFTRWYSLQEYIQILLNNNKLYEKLQTEKINAVYLETLKTLRQNS